MEKLRDVFVRPAVLRWLETSDSSWRTLPVPTGAVLSKAPGENPDRVLLAGSGIAVGYGMASHDQALGGQLARQLSAITGRGAEVETLTDIDLDGAALCAALDARKLSALDAIVTTPGDVERLLLLPPRAFRRGIEMVLDHIAEHGPASLQTFLIGIPPLPGIIRMPRILGWLVRWSAASLNRQLQLACAARANSSFIPFAPTEPVGRTGTGRTYSNWAQLIAPHVSTGLEGHELTRHR